jgi:hypothetical protein
MVDYITKANKDQHFFDKEYILISRRYQLHPVSATISYPNGINDAHSQTREKNYKKERSRYRYP